MLAGITPMTVRTFENGAGRLHANHRDALARVLRAAGVEFDDDGRVWLTRPAAAD